MTTTQRTITIGEDAKIYSYHTKQRGYGRQALYVELVVDNEDGSVSYIKDVYVKDVFPNILEHYQDSYYLSEYTFFDEETGVYRRDSGNGEYTEDCIFASTVDLLNHALNGDELTIEE